MFLGSTTMYSSRSVDSRGLFLRIFNLGYPLEVLEVPLQKANFSGSIVLPEKFAFCRGTSSTPRGYPRLRILRKRPRESTALEEYIVVEPKNIFQLQKFVKLRRAPF